jgi:hypothetical protein
MATLAKNFLADKSLTVRRHGTTLEGCGNDIHMLFGPTGATGNQTKYRSLVRFNHLWGGMARVVKVEMVLRQDTNGAVAHFSPGSKARVHIRRSMSDWNSGNNPENTWDAAEYEWPSQGPEYAEADLQMTSGHPVDAAYLFIDITSVIKPIAPTTVTFVDGSKGGGKTNNGFIIRAPGSEENAAQRGIFMSFDDANSSNRPYLRVTYDSENQKPNAPTLSGPSTTAASFGDSFEGLHNDPDGDPMSGRIIRVYKAGVLQWTLDPNLQAASSVESQSGIFSVPLSLAVGALSSQTDYTWTATTKDSSGIEGLPSAARALRIASSAPSVVATAIPPVAAMANALFGGTYSHPTVSLAGFQMQFRPVASHDDAGFADPATLLWDTGETTPTTGEITSTVIRRPYGGAPMAVGTYTYRIKVKARDGGWSTWDYADFVLTTAYDAGLGNVELTTQVARFAPVRIALYSVFTDITHTTRAAGRGIGYLIGHVDDPMDLGASAYMNGGGEIYFTLPALHPYVAEIEPRQVHYAVEQYYGDRYRPLFNGVITDFDADPETVVFYGVDYPGLLQTAVDERGSTNIELEANGSGGGGSKYNNKALDYIIRDQLMYHKTLADSPVGFITIPPSGAAFSPLPERATIYSTYSEALPFITGIIDSHKQGNGRECRLYARPTNATYTAWEWALIDNWGKDRPNIRLEYGGLLNDFRVVALGDFGTRVLAVGQKRGEATVYRKQGTGGLPENIFGRVAKTRFYPDIKDENDLQRRANEEASQLAKIGKRMALAIRADMLAPFDGWDIGDSIVVDIERGVVDSSEYGSLGLWTILGVEWRYYPDGHTDLTLTVLPKKTASAPPTDLIPSGYPPPSKEWQTGYGVPTTFGEPPTATPPPVALMSRMGGDQITAFADELPLSVEPVEAAGYQDLNTGCTYVLDQEVYDPPFDPLDPYAPLTDNPTYNTYTLVSCPPAPELPVPEEDLDGPAQPTDIVTYPGMSSIAVRWSPVNDPDFAYTEVQIREAYRAPVAAAPPLPAIPERFVGPWVGVQTGGTLIVLTPLQNTTPEDPMTYDIRLRSVDTSGNTRDELGSVKAADEPERGWVDTDGAGQPIQEVAIPVPGNALVWDEAIIEDVFAGNINADWITAGTLHVGGRPSSAGQIEVYDAGLPALPGDPIPDPVPPRLIGVWDKDGILIRKPEGRTDNSRYEMRISDSSIVITDLEDGFDPVTIQPLGIDAASITFGSARGGHNLVLNSSFELGAFGVVALADTLWDLAADWNAYRQGADVNITVGASSLSMATVV